MKKFITLLLLLSALGGYAQKEASNWYFGYNAGIRFLDDGTIEPLAGNAMQTLEGCSSISDANGNLLFYTDGRNVWDKNHVIMPNGNYAAGTGLHGDPSSTQSAIIVPKKGSPNIYYIFTVDEPHHQNAAAYPNQFTGAYTNPSGSVPADDDGFNNGLNYSVVDLSLTGANGSIGNVLTRNVHLKTYNPANADEVKYKCSEKITATGNADGSGYWVITHFIDKFYAFEVTATGVNATPVVTQMAPVVPISGYRRNAIGCIKASPNGKKIAIAHEQKGTTTGGTHYNGGTYLYDFDNASGILSNLKTVVEDKVCYSVEFSPSAKKLYVTTDDGMGGYTYQYDLTATDITASQKIVEVDHYGTLQLGIDGKIYKARNSYWITVIHNPEEDGPLCRARNYETVLNGQAFAGLPPFITSYFYGGILSQNYCLGSATSFKINSDDAFDSIVWDFGDGSPTSSDTAPSHTYAAAGNYTVAATISRNGQLSTVKHQVTINQAAVANTPPNLILCDTDGNGSETFDLTVNNAAILGGQSSSDFAVYYYPTLEEAQKYTVFSTYINTITNTTNPQTVYARVFNYKNFACYAITSFQVSVINTPALTANTFSVCDDATDGNDANGLATFNINTVTATLLPNSSQYTVAYYHNQADAQNEVNALPALFTTTTSGQQVVYIRIEAGSSACMAIIPVTLKVNPLPGITDATLVSCDNDGNPDGFTQFNLKNADGFYTNGDPNLSVVYYHSQADAQNQVNALPALFTNTVNPQHFTVRVTNITTGCYRLLPFHLEVNIGGTIQLTLEECDNDGTPDGLTQFNLIDAGLETAGTTVTYYATTNDMQQQQNPINSLYTNTTADMQTVYARKSGAACDTFYEIKLLVYPVPPIAIEEELDICQNELPATIAAGTTGNGYTYSWSNGETTPSINVNQAGTYTVTVTNAFGCSTERNVIVNVTDVAIIRNIAIHDLNDNNTVTVILETVSGSGFRYSLDKPNGPYQDSNVFDNVAPGAHTVYVYSTNGCGVAHEDIIVLGVPKFFSPNDDGKNDFWNIKGIGTAEYPNCKIYVFDRYGKLITGVNPKGRGWDGRFDGQLMPATDYWYVVDLGNGRTAKGHFSLLR